MSECLKWVLRSYEGSATPSLLVGRKRDWRQPESRPQWDGNTMPPDCAILVGVGKKVAWNSVMPRSFRCLKMFFFSKQSPSVAIRSTASYRLSLPLNNLQDGS
ncbi:hypothetical protein E2C01_052682 [Portunus trituberculatus]|uniref:Uncharacterized protein n=1 Tax=Portunus trituberculatus TaxID=210409 RepID=A0A5B7GMI4_PORTR|nr:hypothetical protein [Portunus trituberculatus]